MNTLSPAGVFLSWVGCKLLPKLQHHHWVALAAEHALRVAQVQPGQLKLCVQPPAALMQLVNTSTGKIMPYHKVAIKTSLSLDSPSENPAPQPGRRLLSRAMCQHAGGVSESCKAAGHAATGCPRASAGTLELPAATPGGQGTGDAGNLLQSRWFSSPGRWKVSRVHKHRLHPHLRCAADVPDGSEALKELLGTGLLWKTGCAPGC